jgi:hypothetical protein
MSDYNYVEEAVDETYQEMKERLSGQPIDFAYMYIMFRRAEEKAKKELENKSIEQKFNRAMAHLRTKL